MKPIKFDGSNGVFFENEKEFMAIPAYQSRDGLVIVCWKVSLFERLKLLLTGKLWYQVLTFNTPLQPMFPMVKYPFKNIPKSKKKAKKGDIEPSPKGKDDKKV